MVTSQNGLDLIKRFEGLCLTAYTCPAGVPTIGWGHTHAVTLGSTITDREAETLLAADVLSVETSVRNLVTVPVNQNQWDAMVSFVFNVGVQRFKTSTLLYKLNHGDAAGAGAEFLKWVFANVGGKMTVLAGLKSRREAESYLFFEPVN